MKKYLPVEVFTDPHGNHTCASNFETNEICMFYGTSHFGTKEVCLATGQPIGRIKDGFTIPVEGCPMKRAMK